MCVGFCMNTREAWSMGRNTLNHGHASSYSQHWICFCFVHQLDHVIRGTLFIATCNSHTTASFTLTKHLTITSQPHLHWPTPDNHITATFTLANTWQSHHSHIYTDQTPDNHITSQPHLQAPDNHITATFTRTWQSHHSHIYKNLTITTLSSAHHLKYILFGFGIIETTTELWTFWNTPDLPDRMAENRV